MTDMRHTTDKPLVDEGLTSYRYKGNYGWIMIGAKHDYAALSEANRSLGTGKASLKNLQRYHKFKYFDVTYLNDTIRLHRQTLWVRHPDCLYGYVWIKYLTAGRNELRTTRQRLIFNNDWECEII